MKVLVFGAKGYLGQQFVEMFDGIPSSVDIADAKAVGEELDMHQPDVVVNTAGKTGRPNIDWCESHKTETIHSNVTGPLVLLEECGKRDIYWVQVNSGCIYQGDKGGEGFSEEDEPNFDGSFYSKTKIWIDQILKDFPVLILRLRMPFDGTDSPRNLISKIKKYDRVLDVQNSLTYLPDFFAAAKALIEKRAVGPYNIVNPGSVSPYEVMQSYKEIVDPSHVFERLTMGHLSEVACTGRSNCILSIKKLEKEGITMRPVSEVVQEALEQMK